MKLVTASLYIHVPFCKKKCDYCDFYSVPEGDWAGGGLLDRFVDALRADIGGQLAGFRVSEPASVYIGGGTPSLLGPGRLKTLLEFLEAAGGRPLNGEFTVEANPESVDEAFLRACLEGGVTRISCGVQSFNKEARRAAGRRGGIERLGAALALLGEAYGGAFSADLISGLPGAGESVLLRDIETLLRYGPAQVSLYDLSVEENTPLYRNVAASKLSLPQADEAARIWIAGRDFLEAAGYPQYEVSAFAPEGKRSAHNIVYWRMGNWLGAGPSASGTLIRDGGGGEARGLRRTVAADLRGYLSEDGPEVLVEELDRDTLIRESFLMGFRYIEGPDTALFQKRFGCPIESLAGETFSRWREHGKMRDGLCALNREGLLMLNKFLTECFIDIDRSAPRRG
ncbi:MAG: coproporphyrinogen III oxidase family protein [Spirochaetaceae bacterium]|jgi:oxygen-independent coproporphyrinogen-3 oxidase|nr:coproporphyrinogen III oxidase family protein [Spirochaetaceae bacterium]